MNTKALNSLADLICRAQEQDRTPMGIAFAIDAAGRHMSPEVAAELAALRAEVAALRAERHVTNEALDDAVQALRARRDDEPGGLYPPAMPWARLMDHEDLADFLDELAAAAIANVDAGAALAEVEKACGTWRLIAEAQYGHNTAPGPDAMTRTFVPVQALREPEGEHYAAVHHDYRISHDLPQAGGQR